MQSNYSRMGKQNKYYGEGANFLPPNLQDDLLVLLPPKYWKKFEWNE